CLLPRRRFRIVAGIGVPWRDVEALKASESAVAVGNALQRRQLSAGPSGLCNQAGPPGGRVGARERAASTYSNGQDHNACGIHTLHFPQDTATLPPPLVELTSYSSKHG